MRRMLILAGINVWIFHRGKKMGYVVPTSTMTAKAVRIRLFPKNAPSRLTSVSIRDGCATVSARKANRASDPAVTKTRNPSSAGPIADCVNEWTEATVPDLVRYVARIVSANVAMTSTKFQDCSIPRRIWTRALCTKAVATNHGINEAFSTGSHAQ